MARYTAGFRTSALTTTSFVWAELRTAVTDRARILEIGLAIGAGATAAATPIALGRSTAVGVSPSATVTPQPGDPADPAASASLATAWTTAPTIASTVPLRRFTLPATVGAGVIWTWALERPLVIGSASAVSSLIVYNPGTGVALPYLDGYIVWDE